MLELVIPDQENVWNSQTKEFTNYKGATIRLEHSLISISKWEAKYHRAFLKPDTEMTMEELLDYIKCMTMTQNVPDEVYEHLTEENFEAIKSYISDPMTATSFSEDAPNITGVNKGRSRQIITSEIIYYWMIAQNIPLECEKWHLSRLMTLIRVCSIKNAEANGQTGRKRSMREIAEANQALNAERRKKLNTKG